MCKRLLSGVNSDLMTSSASSILRISFDVYVAFMCIQNPMVSFSYDETSKGDEISNT